MNGRLTSVEGHLTSVEGRLTSVEGRLTSVEGRLTSVEGRLTSVEVKVDGLGVKVDGLDAKVDRLGEDLRHEMRLLHEDTIANIKALAPDTDQITRNFTEADNKVRADIAERLDPLEAFARTRGFKAD